MPNQTWDDLIGEIGTTAREFIKANRGHKSYREIASELNSFGFVCTASSVRSVCRRLSRARIYASEKSRTSASVMGTRNEIVAESNNARIKTLEDLIKACDIDLNVWEVERHVINKWEVGAKGNVGLHVEPLFQVKAWLIRKEPVAITPVIAPVNISYTPSNRKVQKTSKTNRALILPDPQFGFRKDLQTGVLDPFHDRAALDVALQIATEYAIDKVVWLGDVLDLPDWSDKFVRSPEYHWTTQPSVIEASWWLREFKVATDAETVILGGNHEARLDRSINTHMIQAYDLKATDALDSPPALSVPSLLGLRGLEIQYIADYPNGEVWINDQVRCIHGDVARSSSGATVSSMVDDIQETSIQGHVHRIESASKTLHTSRGPRAVAMWSVGCLCRIDGVVPGVKARQNWQQAIGIVDYTDTEHHVTAIPINNGKALYHGDVFTARNRLSDLRRDTNWKF